MSDFSHLIHALHAKLPGFDSVFTVGILQQSVARLANGGLSIFPTQSFRKIPSICDEGYLNGASI